MRNARKSTAIEQWAERWAVCMNKETYQMIELKKEVAEKDIWARTKIQESYMELTEKKFRCIGTLPTAGLWVYQKDPWENCLRIPYRNMQDGKLPKDPEDEPIFQETEEEWDEIWGGWKQE
jgi:methylmalonyl-CoA mutase N-terminal domain/subunit